MSQTKHSFEEKGKSKNLLFICYNAARGYILFILLIQVFCLI